MMETFLHVCGCVCMCVYELVCACTILFLVLKEKLFAYMCKVLPRKLLNTWNLTHRNWCHGCYGYVVFVVLGKGKNTTMMHF
jgi:hypothetical protein